MSLMGEIATESTVRDMVTYIEKRLAQTTDRLVRAELKAAGLHALTLFEWDTPVWAARYRVLFEGVLP